MAFSDGGNEQGLYSEINVTPLVDVVLVLLVIFMVTTTYIVAQSIPVDLPRAATGENVITTLVITIDSKGDIYLEDEKVDVDVLRARVRAAGEASDDLRAVIAADRNVRHGLFVRVIDVIRDAGVVKFAINVEEEDIVR
ncbi:MAG: biopolymer transporter ExbD [Deltaproteobacteria bacterium]|nr:biopolymer transporter ExbD [Deltaproteobacteria bacterium]